MEEFASAQRVDLELFQGCDCDDSIELLNENGEPVTFYDCTFKGQIKKHIHDSEALANIDVAYNALNKTVDFTISAEESKKLTFSGPKPTEVFFYDIIYETAKGKRYPICYGQITVRAGVTT